MTMPSAADLRERLRRLSPDELVAIASSCSHTHEARDTARTLLIERDVPPPPAVVDALPRSSPPDEPRLPAFLGFAAPIVVNVLVVVVTWHWSGGWSMFLIGLWQLFYVVPLVLILYAVRQGRVARGALVAAAVTFVWSVALGSSFPFGH